MSFSLPAELWETIFNFATEDERIYRTRFPTAMDTSEWFPSMQFIEGEFEEIWIIRGPGEIANSAQRRGYLTKKAIQHTCRPFKWIVTENLYRYLYLPTSHGFSSLVNTISGEPELGLKTRKLQLFAAPKVADALLLRDVLRHCKNLEILIIEAPMDKAVFTSFADAIRRTVKALKLKLTTDAVSTLIWMLSSRSRLEAASFSFSRPIEKDKPKMRRSLGTMGSEFDVPLGAAGNINVELPFLEQLEVTGPCTAFVDEVTGWTLPRLRSLTLDTESEGDNLPDLLEFLTNHGTGLEYLDVNGFSEVPQPIPDILNLCPMLSTLVFNPDWKLFPATAQQHEYAVAVLARTPHNAITHIGLHDLTTALAVLEDPATEAEDPERNLGRTIHRQALRFRNDAVFRALTKKNFPSLKVVRAVSRPLLAALERWDGPEEREGVKRWQRWWDDCTKAGIRLEDCTGDFLGTLPDVVEEVEDSDEEDEEEEEESEEQREITSWIKIGEERERAEQEEKEREKRDTATMRDEFRKVILESQAARDISKKESAGPLISLISSMAPGFGGTPPMGMGMGMGMGPMGMGMGMGMPQSPLPAAMSPTFGTPNYYGYPGMQASPGPPGYNFGSPYWSPPPR